MVLRNKVGKFAVCFLDGSVINFSNFEGRSGFFLVNLKFGFGNKVKVFGKFDDLSKLGGFEVRKFRDRLNSYFACIDEICLQIIVRF